MSQFRIIVRTLNHGYLVGDWSERLTPGQALKATNMIKRNWGELTYLSLSVGENEIIVPIEVLRQSIVVLEARKAVVEEGTGDGDTSDR